MRSGVCTALLGLLWSSPTWATGVPGSEGYVADPLNAEPFRPALDPGGLLTTESPAVAGRIAARADVWTAHNLLLWTPAQSEPLKLIGDTVTVHLAGGRTLGRTRLAVSTPLHLLATSDAYDVPALVAGDVRLSVKRPLTTWLAAQGDLSAALGGSAYQLGAASPGIDLSLAGGWRGERRALLGNVGVRLQEATTLQTLNTGELTLGNAAWFRLGGAQTLNAAHTLELTAEVYGAVASNQIAGQPVEALLGLQGRHPERDRVLRAGVGMGVRQGIGAPAWRLLVGVGHDHAAPPPPLDAPALTPGDLPPTGG